MMGEQQRQPLFKAYSCEKQRCDYINKNYNSMKDYIEGGGSNIPSRNMAEESNYKLVQQI